MSSDLTPYATGVLLPADARRAGRAVSRHQSVSHVRVAAADADADAAMGKAAALTSAVGSAMGDVVRVAQAQRTLEQLAPEASGRLAMLADDHALAMTDILAELRRDLRRR